MQLTSGPTDVFLQRHLSHETRLPAEQLPSNDARNMLRDRPLIVADALHTEAFDLAGRAFLRAKVLRASAGENTYSRAFVDAETNAVYEECSRAFSESLQAKRATNSAESFIPPSITKKIADAMDLISVFPRIFGVTRPTVWKNLTRAADEQTGMTRLRSLANEDEFASVRTSALAPLPNFRAAALRSDDAIEQAKVARVKIARQGATVRDSTVQSALRKLGAAETYLVRRHALSEETHSMQFERSRKLAREHIGAIQRYRDGIFEDLHFADGSVLKSADE